MKQKCRSLTRRTGSIILILTLILGALSPAATMQTDAASKKWKPAYKKILKNWKSVEKYEDMSYLKTYFGSNYKFNRYFTYDVNKDGTPELFLYSTTMGLTEVLTYKNGKVIGLGYDDIDGINKSKKAIIVHGHWHGAGGSYTNEWSVYKLGKKKLSLKYYIDNMNGNRYIYTGSGKTSSSKATYNKIKKSYVTGRTKFSKFKKYKLTSIKGL